MRNSLKKTLSVIGEITLATCESIRRFIEKAASRKLLVWGVATYFTYVMILDPQLWFVLSLIYLGVQGALDWKGMASSFIQHRPQPLPKEKSDEQSVSLPTESPSEHNPQVD